MDAVEKYRERKRNREFAEKRTGQAKNALTWVIAIASLILGVVGLVKGGPEDNYAIVYAIVIVDSVLLIVWGVLVGWQHHRVRSESDLEKASFELREQGRQCEYETSLRAKEQDIAVLLDRVSLEEGTIKDTIVGFNYCISAMSKGMSRLYSIAGKYYDELDSLGRFWADTEAELPDLKQGGSHAAKCAKKAKTALDCEFTRRSCFLVDEATSSFIREHNSFMCSLTNRIKAMLESYLVSQGLDKMVSIAIKQFVRPGTRPELLSRSLESNVYTSFRDSETWERKRRIEIPTRKYTVASNSDFYCCLSGSKYFIYNNKSEADSDFRMQSGNFGKYYNCGVTALIAQEGIEHDTSAEVYGFIACDALNVEGDASTVFDETSAMILMAASKLIATYYDNLEEVWDNLRLSAIMDLDQSVDDEVCSSRFWEKYMEYLDGGKMEREDA